jgi:hypothetical protein
VEAAASALAALAAAGEASRRTTRSRRNSHEERSVGGGGGFGLLMTRSRRWSAMAAEQDSGSTPLFPTPPAGPAAPAPADAASSAPSAAMASEMRADVQCAPIQSTPVPIEQPARGAAVAVHDRSRAAPLSCGAKVVAPASPPPLHLTKSKHAAILAWAPSVGRTPPSFVEGGAGSLALRNPQASLGATSDASGGFGDGGDAGSFCIPVAVGASGSPGRGVGGGGPQTRQQQRAAGSRLAQRPSAAAGGVATPQLLDDQYLGLVAAGSEIGWAKGKQGSKAAAAAATLAVHGTQQRPALVVAAQVATTTAAAAAPPMAASSGSRIAKALLAKASAASASGLMVSPLKRGANLSVAPAGYRYSEVASVYAGGGGGGAADDALTQPSGSQVYGDTARMALLDNDAAAFEEVLPGSGPDHQHWRWSWSPCWSVADWPVLGFAPAVVCSFVDTLVCVERS